MLTYEHLTKTLANSEWILEKKRQSPRNYSYTEVAIPIIAGATAGIAFVLLLNLRSNKRIFFCRISIMDLGYSV